MKLIVGLGNPTTKYRGTYHNLGFMVLDELADLLKVKIKTKECLALTANVVVDGEKAVLAKPQTFMNLSGDSVRQLARKYGVYPEDIFVVFDDADIPLGKLRIKTEGSGGTHNGMKNIVSVMQTENIKRIRVGIKCSEIEERSVEIADKVLSKIAYEDKAVLKKSVDTAAKALLDYLLGKDLENIKLHLND